MKSISAKSYATTAAAILLFVLALRMGWSSDDAFISFRAAANLVSGYGLTSNPGERVQAFTNPLWTLLVALGYALFREPYWVGMGLNLMCTLGLTLLLTLRASIGWASALTAVLLACSTSFLAFSTGGLENPLAHLLIAAFVLERLRWAPSPWKSFVLAGLIGFNRLDHLVIVLPPLAAELIVEVRRGRWRSLIAPAAVGAAPLLAWLLFATVYYGFPFPNTASAKLNVALPRSSVLAQGVTYLVDSALRDPLLLIVISLGAVLAFRRHRERPAAVWLAAGALLYVVYVVWVGGDFMGGRFLTAPYLVAAVLVAEAVTELGTVPAAVTAAVALLAGRTVFDTLPTDGPGVCTLPPSGIVDERACYIDHMGIAQNIRAKKYESHGYFKEGAELRKQRGPIVSGLVGMGNFSAGPGVYMVDPHALTDPLLARIQFTGKDNWRVGHLVRALPNGYLESLRDGKNHIQDPCVRALWDDLRIVTRGPIFSGQRFAKILALNFGAGSCPAPKN